LTEAVAQKRNDQKLNSLTRIPIVANDMIGGPFTIARILNHKEFEPPL